MRLRNWCASTRGNSGGDPHHAGRRTLFSTAYENDPITIPQNAEPSPSHVMPDAVARNVISDASRWLSSQKISLSY